MSSDPDLKEPTANTEGIVLHVCDMTSVKRGQLIAFFIFCFSGLVLFLASFGPRARGYGLQYFFWFLGALFLSFGMASFLGLLFVKPIVIQTNGVFFPFRIVLLFLLLPDGRLIRFEQIASIGHDFGLNITTENGRKYIIPPRVDELDMVEDLIRKGMASADRSGATGPPG